MLNSIQRLAVTLIVQSLLYGIYLATLTQCVRWLVFTDKGWKLRDKIHSLVMTLATIFIFLTSTTNLIASLQYVLESIRKDEKRQMYDIVMAMGISAVITFISIDAVLIYRCWIVYKKSWRIICVPVTFWLASIACSALFSYYIGLNFLKGQPHQLKFIQNEEEAITGVYVCAIATTIYTTTAIIYRIWRTRKTSGGNPKKLNFIMRILAESGILYTSTVIFSLAGGLVATRNDSTWVNYFISDISDSINFSMAGITFNWLLIRVYQSRVEMQDSLADSRSFDGDGSLSTLQFNDSRMVASKAPSSNAVAGIDEIQEQHMSSDEKDEI